MYPPLYFLAKIYLLNMHFGRPGLTNGPCFTSKDNIHRVRRVTCMIKKASHIYKSAHTRKHENNIIMLNILTIMQKYN